MTNSPLPGTSPAVSELSAVTQDYLKHIWTAQEWAEVKVSTKSLADALGVSASTASEAIRKLAEQGLVNHAKYGAVTLTDAGRVAATAMVRRHRLLETFLVSELGYGWDEVHDEAEVLEHAVSERFLAKVDERLGFPDRDPHGDPIPQPDGTVPTPDAQLLSELEAGRVCTVARISDSDPEMLRYFQDVGIAPDARIGVVELRKFLGTVAVTVNDGAAIDLGDVAAQSIWVREN